MVLFFVLIFVIECEVFMEFFWIIFLLMVLRVFLRFGCGDCVICGGFFLIVLLVSFGLVMWDRIVGRRLI